MTSAAEEGRIGRALESVKGWTREIILVLNQEVTDRTEEIARDHGAKVFREPWKGYIGQFNSAAEKATSEWILGLDSDEVVSPELRQEIEALFADEAATDGCVAFSIPRLCWYCERWIRHGDWYPDRQTRLWRRGQARWAGVDPHAKLQVDGTTRKLRGDLHHYSRQSINDHLRKVIPFSDEFVRQHLDGAGEPGMLDMTVRPMWRFFRSYCLRLGFLDGWPGYYIAWHTAFSTLVRYAKLREAGLKKGGKTE